MAAQKIGSQLSSAIAYAHSLSILHRDVKPQNVLLTTDKDLPLKALLSDWGSATTIRECELLQGPRFTTLPYAAPEVLAVAPYGFASDVWSFACTFVEILTTKCLFALETAQRTDEETLKYIQRTLANGAERVVDALKAAGSQDMVDALLTILQFDAAKRERMHLMAASFDAPLPLAQLPNSGLFDAQAEQRALLYRICPLLKWLSEFNSAVGLHALFPGDFIPVLLGAPLPCIRPHLICAVLKMFHLQKNLRENVEFADRKSTASLIAIALETCASAKKDPVAQRQHGQVAHHTGPTPGWRQLGVVVKAPPGKRGLSNFRLYGVDWTYKDKPTKETRKFKLAPAPRRPDILDRIAAKIAELGFPLSLATGREIVSAVQKVAAILREEMWDVGLYTSQYLARKLVWRWIDELVHKNCNWDDVTIKELLDVIPDERGHLQELYDFGGHWPVAVLACILPGTLPFLLSMFACLMEPTEYKKVTPCQSKERIDNVLNTFVIDHGYNPCPAWLVEQMLEMEEDALDQSRGIAAVGNDCPAGVNGNDGNVAIELPPKRARLEDEHELVTATQLSIWAYRLPTHATDGDLHRVKSSTMSYNYWECNTCGTWRKTKAELEKCPCLGFTPLTDLHTASLRNMIAWIRKQSSESDACMCAHPNLMKVMKIVIDLFPAAELEKLKLLSSGACKD